MSRISREEYYMAIAKISSLRGNCGRLQVGCAIISDGRVIVTGYNGPLKNGCDLGKCDLNKPCTEAIHAEANAIAFSAKMGIPLKGSSMYLTHSPCLKCAELIIQAGIAEVVYNEEFRSNEGLLLLRNNNIQTVEYGK
jgi:dCMP deaminase